MSSNPSSPIAPASAVSAETPSPVPEPLEDQLKALRVDVERLKKKPKDNWDKIQAVSSLSSGVAVVVIGYLLTGSVNRVVQERQLQVSNANEMRELIARMADEKTSLPEVEAAASMLALYGRYAIAPLINEIQRGLSTSESAAMEGLRMIAVAEPDATCAEMARVLGNRTRVFSWKTHLRAAQLLADADCKNTLAMLRSYRMLIDSDRYKSIIREEPVPTADDLVRLTLAIERTITIMER